MPEKVVLTCKRRPFCSKVYYKRDSLYLKVFGVGRVFVVVVLVALRQRVQAVGHLVDDQLQGLRKMKLLLAEYSININSM